MKDYLVIYRNIEGKKYHQFIISELKLCDFVLKTPADDIIDIVEVAKNLTMTDIKELLKKQGA